jgi:hypothetical protein
LNRLQNLGNLSKLPTLDDRERIVGHSSLPLGELPIAHANLLIDKKAEQELPFLLAFRILNEKKILEKFLNSSCKSPRSRYDSYCSAV